MTKESITPNTRGNEKQERKKTPEEELYDKKAEKIWNAFGSLFNGSGLNLMTLGNSSEPGFSGDGASLFMMARIQTPDGQKVVRPFKLGWGEFSVATFTGDLLESNSEVGDNLSNRWDEETERSKTENKRNLRSLEFPIYILPQRTGYFDLQEKGFNEYLNSPQNYFAKNAELVYDRGSLIQQKRNYGENTDNLNSTQKIKELPVPNFNEVLADIRNKILDNQMDRNEFATCLKILPENTEELKKLLKICYFEKGENMEEEQIKKFLDLKADCSPKEREKRRHIWKTLQFISRLGLDNPYAISWGGDHAIKAIEEIKKSFNFSTNRFE